MTNSLPTLKSKPTLIQLIGLPRSGKGTYALSTGYPIVCPDGIRMALFGGSFAIEAEPMVWTMAKYFVRSLFFTGHPVVILDACSHTERRRSEWKSKDWISKYVLLDTPKEECIRRALANGQEYLVDVINRMSKEFEAPPEPYEIVKWKQI